MAEQVKQKPLRVGMIGASNVNFGSKGLPWNHAARLEKIGGVMIVGIADLDINRAQNALASRRASPKGDIYENCGVYASAEELLANAELDVVFLGIDPGSRGSHEAGKDIELQVIRRGLHLFVEKPLSVVPPEAIQQYVHDVTATQKEQNVILSVGYMFRYHAAIMKMRELIKENGGNVMAFSGRYHLAYSMGVPPFWWFIDKSGGPIVEQATHFCDLARYLAGDVIEESITTICLRDNDPVETGKLKEADKFESTIPSEKRVPRITATQWRFASGGIGTLMHTLCAHGYSFEASIDVLMDGLKMTLEEPYSDKCCLRVRDFRTGNDDETVLHFGDDDPYKTEIETFLDAVRNTNHAAIRSSYDDAAKTYSLSWAIRRSGEKGKFPH